MTRNSGSNQATTTVLRLALAIACANLLVFVARMLSAPIETCVAYVPDDAFYYLGLARNFAERGQWSFDSGISTTTGFHPLHAYTLALVHWVLTPAATSFVRVGILVSAFPAVAAVIAAALWGWKRSPALTAAVALVVGASSFALSAISVMEWSYVVACAAAYAALYARYGDRFAIRPAAGIAVAGFLGSLSRTDFGGFPFALLVAAAVLCWLDKSRRPAILLMPLAGFVGAVTGLLFVFLQNVLIAGHPIQSSARMKAFWATVYGPSYRESIDLPARTAGGAWQFFAIVALIAVALYAGRRQPRGSSDSSTPPRALLLASALTVVGYIALYTRNGGVQPWYTAGLIVPITVLLAAAFSRLFPASDAPPRPALANVVAVVIAAMTVLSAGGLQFAFRLTPPWPHQLAMMNAGLVLKHQPPDGRVGSWNAGIIGYFAGGTVVNLDGLVNDGVYEYIVGGKLIDYLDQQDIRYIVDFENMLYKRHRVRCGTNDREFLRRVQPISLIDPSDYGWKNITLFRVAPKGASARGR